MMATTYPYISSAGPLVKVFERFRKQFPQEVTAETLRKLGIAPKNESYVINILRFIGLIDEAGKKIDNNTKAFLQHDDTKFAEQLSEIVKKSYNELFELHGEDVWTSPRADLVTFFRTSDGSSDVVGKRQAITFNALAVLSGHGEAFVPRENTGPRKRTGATNGQTKNSPKPTSLPNSTKPKDIEKPINQQPGTVGLTVRIEVNLPANGDQQTYDAIFQSIRKNLIDGE